MAWSKSHDNLRHVLYDICTDNDCELHNPDIALREEVMSTTELAYIIVGAKLNPEERYRLIEWAANVYEEQTREAKSSAGR